MNAHRTKRRASGLTLIELLVIIGVVVLLAALLLPALAAAHHKSGRINCVSNLKEISTAFRTGEEAEGNKYPMEDVLTNSETMKLVANGNAYLLWQTMSNELGRPKELYAPYQAKFTPVGTLGTPKVLHCPDDKRRKAATSFSEGFSDANISYFFSLDTAEAYPQMILVGDDNLAVDGVRVKPGILTVSTSSAITWTKEQHRFCGNLLMADGSVMQVTSAGLKTAIADGSSSVLTNVVTPRWLIP